MILSNLQVVQLDQGIDYVRTKLISNIPIPAGYGLVKIKNVIAPQISLLETLREDIVLSLGEVREDGSLVFDSEEKKKQVEDRIKELLAIKEDYNLPLISISSLESLSAPYDVIEALHPVLTDL